MEIRCQEKKIEVENLLEEIGESKTKTKIAILEFIQLSTAPVSVAQIQEKIPDTNESTIFRNINKFISKQILKEVDLGEGFRRFELKPSDHHHHHIICKSCGKIDAIHNCNIAALEKQLVKLGYSNIQHRIEFSGLCNRCD